MKGENCHEKIARLLGNCAPFRRMSVKHQAAGKKIAASLQAFMSLLYMGSGAFLFTSEKANRILPSDFIPWTAAALLLYGLFRAYRAWNQIKPKGIRL